jgi:tRNA-Thr(GGU) m(6)t(6)A37 methyltransferase TsaA
MTYTKERFVENIVLKPIGIVRSDRKEPTDDFWGKVISTIELDAKCFSAESLLGLSDFSHIEVIYHFHKVDPQSILLNAGHPRENPNWPRVGIFAQRKKNRPNRIGVSVCRLLKVENSTLTVQSLDAIDGTPVIDIKPLVREFIPLVSEIHQPSWQSELMTNYFSERQS